MNLWLIELQFEQIIKGTGRELGEVFSECKRERVRIREREELLAFLAELVEFLGNLISLEFDDHAHDLVVLCEEVSFAAFERQDDLLCKFLVLA